MRRATGKCDRGIGETMFLIRGSANRSGVVPDDDEQQCSDGRVSLIDNGSDVSRDTLLQLDFLWDSDRRADNPSCVRAGCILM